MGLGVRVCVGGGGDIKWVTQLNCGGSVPLRTVKRRMINNDNNNNNRTLSLSPSQFIFSNKASWGNITDNTWEEHEHDVPASRQ